MDDTPVGPGFVRPTDEQGVAVRRLRRCRAGQGGGRGPPAPPAAAPTMSAPLRSRPRRFTAVAGSPTVVSSGFS